MSSLPHPASRPAEGSPEADVPPVLAGLIDDAALFPPSDAGMAEAVQAHRRHRAAPYAALIGRFLCSAARVAELRAALDAQPTRTGPSGLARAEQPVGAGPVRLGVIVGAGLENMPRALADVAADPRLVLEAVEIALPAGTSGRHDVSDATKRAVAALPTGVLGYVEVPRVHGWEAALDVLSALGRGAKLRTGGTTAAEVPSVAEVARFLTACTARLLPLKCTAGLHHAVRRHDRQTGADEHGFLNILAAAGAAVAGEDPARLLSEQDGAALTEQARRLDPNLVRGLFTSFGSCSIAEPVAELRALGLLP